MKLASKRTGVKVTAHRLRHTCATQLVNAGCHITTIKELLGHRRLNSTMVYARVHNRTVREDYYSAMAVIEGQLELQMSQAHKEISAESGSEQDKNGNDGQRLLALVDALAAGTLDDRQRQIADELRSGILALAG